MIHTLEISYEISLPDAITCVHRLNERTHSHKGYRITNFLDTAKRSSPLVFVVPELSGILTITVKKHQFRNSNPAFRIYFLIEAEILRTGTDTLDLYYSSSEHAKQLQTQYAKAIYNLFPEAFNGRPAHLLFTSNFADPKSYTEEEHLHMHGGMYSLPYLALASVKRIDFTYDMVLNSPEDANLYVYMVQNSYYDSRKKVEIKGKNRNPDSSLKCYDKIYESGSRAISFYDKYNKMMDPVYNSRSNITQIRETARNIARIELPIFNPARSKVKSMTWLQIPEDAIPLGPLPYLANEQVPFIAFFKEFAYHIGNGPDLKWYKRGELKKQLNIKVRQNKITKGARDFMMKISQAIAQGRCKNDSYSLKKAITAFKENGKITLHKKRNKNKEQVLEEFQCTIDQYHYYNRLAMENGIMLVTIPDSKHVKELSVQSPIRNFDHHKVGSQLTTNMLPYQSISNYDAQELEPVKDLYDAILSFLYDKYDQYADNHNKNMNALRIPAEEFELETEQ